MEDGGRVGELFLFLLLPFSLFIAEFLIGVVSYFRGGKCWAGVA
jgi:hypothetical protein